MASVHGQSSKRLIITIDGPSGAGKTSASKLLAQKLGYRYIDTGALYRAVAVAAHAEGIAADDEKGLDALCRRISIDLQSSQAGLRVILNGRDITAEIRAPHISMLASAVSAKPVVRTFLLSLQRSLANQKGVVAEGRDMGTVVFPHAEAKFFLDADPHLRAQRRYEELKVQGKDAPNLESIEKDMIQRDRNDSTRSVAPLEPAADAVRIDSTTLSLEQVVECMLNHVARI
ncbi:MAG: (d)CMP kinase [Desulfobacteraceae bacterium]|nr:MAG: (d)CMP kinase [Desulfobacteraceae bacterium]